MSTPSSRPQGLILARAEHGRGLVGVWPLNEPDGEMVTGNGESIRTHAAFVWSVADLLRGDYKQSEYGQVIPPLVVLRRLDCVLDPTKDKVLDTATKLAGKVDNIDPLLRQAAGGEQFYNTSPLRSRDGHDLDREHSGN